MSAGDRNAKKGGCLLVELSVSSGGMENEGRFGSYYCAVCGGENETFVDLSAGSRQSYVEDCTVCCRPNILTVTVEVEGGQISIEAEFEG
jgi:hypothetical protein